MKVEWNLYAEGECDERELSQIELCIFDFKVMPTKSWILYVKRKCPACDETKWIKYGLNACDSCTP